MKGFSSRGTGVPLFASPNSFCPARNPAVLFSGAPCGRQDGGIGLSARSISFVCRMVKHPCSVHALAQHHVGAMPGRLRGRVFALGLAAPAFGANAFRGAAVKNCYCSIVSILSMDVIWFCIKPVRSTSTALKIRP